jgi:two-component system phosphate regulon sensor histidine kinase PhoR
LRLTIPIALTAVAAAIVVNLLVLASLRQQLADDLRLRLERQASLLSSLRLTAGESLQLRGMAIVGLRSDGTHRLLFRPEGPSDWAVFDANHQIQPPEAFLDAPAVGIRLPANPDLWQNILRPDETAAILVSTRSTVILYEELRIRVILLTVAGYLAVVLTALVVGSLLGTRIRRLTRRITALSDDDSGVLARERTADELEALSNQLEHANTTLVRTNTSIERLQKMRSEFLANVSHEVRTPLFAMKGYLETLLDGGIDDPKVNRIFVEKAQKHVQRLDLLLRDLIEISRIESGDMRMSFRYFRLADLFQAAYDAQFEVAQAKGQIIEVHSLERSVLGDRDRLLQVLNNLLENATAYSPRGAKITLGAAESGARVTVAVTDNGPGIAPEHQDRVFERFYRVDPDRSREAGGTGLGLAIVKHIVEAHGSKVFMKSNLGSGASFYFELQKEP